MQNISFAIIYKAMGVTPVALPEFQNSIMEKDVQEILISHLIPGRSLRVMKPDTSNILLELIFANTEGILEGIVRSEGTRCLWHTSG
jgi:hypothetical protein